MTLPLFLTAGLLVAAAVVGLRASSRGGLGLHLPSVLQLVVAVCLVVIPAPNRPALQNGSQKVVAMPSVSKHWR